MIEFTGKIKILKKYPAYCLIILIFFFTLPYYIDYNKTQTGI